MKPSTHTPAALPKRTLSGIALLVLMPVLLVADFPALGSNEGFIKDLRLVSTLSIAPSWRLEAQSSQLSIRPTLFSAADGLAQISRLEYTIQPSQDYSLTAAIERWPGDMPIIGSALAVNTFRETEGNLDYMVGIGWHHVRSAREFSQRDLVVNLGALGTRKSLNYQISGGPILRHSNTRHTAYTLEDAAEWAACAQLGVDLFESLGLTAAIPFSKHGWGISLSLGWNLGHRAMEGTNPLQERK